MTLASYIKGKDNPVLGSPSRVTDSRAAEARLVQGICGSRKLIVIRCTNSNNMSISHLFRTGVRAGVLGLVRLRGTVSSYDPVTSATTSGFRVAKGRCRYIFASVISGQHTAEMSVKLSNQPMRGRARLGMLIEIASGHLLPIAGSRRGGINCRALRRLTRGPPRGRSIASTLARTNATGTDIVGVGGTSFGFNPGCVGRLRPANRDCRNACQN